MIVTSTHEQKIGSRVTIEFDAYGKRMDQPQPCVILGPATAEDYLADGPPVPIEKLGAVRFFYHASTD